jgi:hypothetical protein
VADAVDAPEYPEERLLLEPPPDLLPRDARVQKLLPGHDPVLGSGNPPDHLFNCQILVFHMNT